MRCVPCSFTSPAAASSPLSPSRPCRHFSSVPVTDPSVASDVLRLVTDTADITDAEERDSRVCYSCEVVKVRGSRRHVWHSAAVWMGLGRGNVVLQSLFKLHPSLSTCAYRGGGACRNALIMYIPVGVSNCVLALYKPVSCRVVLGVCIADPISACMACSPCVPSTAPTATAVWKGWTTTATGWVWLLVPSVLHAVRNVSGVALSALLWSLSTRVCGSGSGRLVLCLLAVACWLLRLGTALGRPTTVSSSCGPPHSSRQRCSCYTS
jgi:hypothetical protein